MYLAIPDYVVIAVLLLIPLVIGIFYARKDSKKVNREEYLLGGRRMGLLPVTFSLFVTYFSAIALIGFPSEVYTYGAMCVGFFVAAGAANVIGCYTMIPLMFPLQLTSLFEYFEMRYQSRSVRILSTFIGMLQNYFYMVIALLAPGLAAQAAAGIPFWMSVAVVGSLGTLYTSIGGLKSVIWTDALQIFVILFGTILLTVRGTVVVGGVDRVWEIAQAGGRTSVMEFSPDPRVRHTWWGMIFGVTFMRNDEAEVKTIGKRSGEVQVPDKNYNTSRLSSIYNQSTLQRVSSMKSIKSAKRSFLLQVPCNIIFGLFLIPQGIVLYSYFYVMRCDPLKGGIISNPNQMTLVFVLHVLENYPGLAGLYMSTIFSGALSTLSSGINALAANTVEDILPSYLRGVSERNVTILAKVLAFVYGISIVGFAYFARSLTGPVTQMAASVFGACGSILVGMFLVACTVPWVNKYGALVGGIVSLVVNIWMVVGSRLYGRKPPTLPSLPTDQCSSLRKDHWTLNTTVQWESTPNITVLNGDIISEASIEDPHPHLGFFLYEVSYIWYSLIGIVVCTVVTLIVSKLTCHDKAKTQPKLILPILRRFWQLEGVGETSAVEINHSVSRTNMI